MVQDPEPKALAASEVPSAPATGDIPATELPAVEDPPVGGLPEDEFPAVEDIPATELPAVKDPLGGLPGDGSPAAGDSPAMEPAAAEPLAEPPELSEESSPAISAASLADASVVEDVDAPADAFLAGEEMETTALPAVTIAAPEVPSAPVAGDLAAIELPAVEDPPGGLPGGESPAVEPAAAEPLAEPPELSEESSPAISAASLADAFLAGEEMETTALPAVLLTSDADLPAAVASAGASPSEEVVAPESAAREAPAFDETAALTSPSEEMETTALPAVALAVPEAPSAAAAGDPAAIELPAVGDPPVGGLPEDEFPAAGDSPAVEPAAAERLAELPELSEELSPAISAASLADASVVEDVDAPVDAFLAGEEMETTALPAVLLAAPEVPSAPVAGDPAAIELPAVGDTPVGGGPEDEFPAAEDIPATELPAVEDPPVGGLPGDGSPAAGDSPAVEPAAVEPLTAEPLAELPELSEESSPAISAASLDAPAAEDVDAPADAFLAGEEMETTALPAVLLASDADLPAAVVSDRAPPSEAMASETMANETEAGESGVGEAVSPLAWVEPQRRETKDERRAGGEVSPLAWVEPQRRGTIFHSDPHELLDVEWALDPSAAPQAAEAGEEEMLFEEAAPAEAMPPPAEASPADAPPSESIPAVDAEGLGAEGLDLQGAPLHDEFGMLAEFVAECKEHLEEANTKLLELERDPQRQEPLNAVFRGLHSIKGAAGFFKLRNLERLTHDAENLLDTLRSGKQRVAPRIVDVILETLDHLSRMVDGIKRALEGDMRLPPDAQLLTVLAQLQAAQRWAAGDTPETTIPPPPSETSAAEGHLHPTSPVADRPAVVGSPSPAARIPVAHLPAASPPAGELGPEALSSAGISEPATAEPQADLPPEPPAETPSAPMHEAVHESRRETVRETFRETVRVDYERLQDMVEAIGELVIVESMLHQDADLARIASEPLAKKLHHLSLVTRQLQEVGTAIRTVPIAGIFRRLERLTRDLARRFGKQVQFVMEGEETELDRAYVEKLQDPLMHMLRNAIDHGIEPPSLRQANGKPSQGTIRVRAHHAGGNILIEMEDDGGGIDRQHILQEAAKRGIVKLPEREENPLSDREVLDLVFHAGFSTATAVTDVSGRGVGMNVVQQNVEALRGSISLDSQPQQGTQVTISLPLTMALIDGMVVRVGTKLFIIPVLSVVETLRPNANQVRSFLGKGELLLLRREQLPLYRLAYLFSVEGSVREPERGLVVILEYHERRLGLLVDDLLGLQQTVIKNLGPYLHSAPGISGGAIMGDGRVGLIIDVNGLVRLARSVPPPTARQLEMLSPPMEDAAPSALDEEVISAIDTTVREASSSNAPSGVRLAQGALPYGAFSRASPIDAASAALSEDGRRDDLYPAHLERFRAFWQDEQARRLVERQMTEKQPHPQSEPLPRVPSRQRSQAFLRSQLNKLVATDEAPASSS